MERTRQPQRDQRRSGDPLQRRRFASMGTWIECLVEASGSPGLDAAFAHVEHEFARLERKLSRFRADSELSRLNRERSIEAGDELLELTRLALAARERTGGRFDPTVHDALIAAGYDRTFSDVCNETRTPAAEAQASADSGPLPAPPREVRASGRVVRVSGRVVRVSGRRIELGRGASLDFGGIAKGYAADRCVAGLAAFGPALVNAGGDLAVSGPRASGPWPVALDLPADGLAAGPDGLAAGPDGHAAGPDGHAAGPGGGRLVLAIAHGGLATSGRDRRRWLREGQERHHLIDPRTLEPAEGGPRSVTVTAPTATAAEIAAKSLFLAGSNAEREARLAGRPAVIVGEDGRMRIFGIAATGDLAARTEGLAA